MAAIQRALALAPRNRLLMRRGLSVRIILSLLVLLALSSCEDLIGSEEEPPPTYTVGGTVTIGDTTIPVSDASITVGEYFAVTDREGRFSVSSVPSGSHNVIVEKDGYATYRQTHTVNRNLDVSVSLSYATGEAPTVRIFFVTPAGAVVPALPVTLARDAGETDLVTDADGSIVLNVIDYLNAPFTISVASESFSELSREFVLEELESTTAEIEVTPLPVAQSAISDVETRLNAADDIVIEWSCDSPFVADYRVMAKERHLVSGWTLETDPAFGDWYEIYEGPEETFTHEVAPTYNHEYVYAVIPLNLSGEAPDEWSLNGVQALDINVTWVLDQRMAYIGSLVFAVPEIGRNDGIYLHGEWTLNHAFENGFSPPGWKIYYSESPDMADERVLLESASPEHESFGNGGSLVRVSGSTDILNMVELPRSLTGKNLYLRVEKQNLSSFQFQAIVYNDTGDYTIADTPPDRFTITYDPNGATSGAAPSEETASYNTTIDLPSQATLAKDSHAFNGWNTAADGSGTTYEVGADYTLDGNITLYAQWEPTYTVTYDPNGADGGTVPSDGTTYREGDTVTVLANTGSLIRNGFTFQGWNTAADGSGETYTPAQELQLPAADLVLFAHWREYAIGDTGPAGGYIFYDDEADGVDDIAGARYLEAAPSDIAVSGGYGHVWGGEGTSVGGTGTAIGTGAANTLAIVAEYGASDPSENTGNYAARLADRYEYGGFDDWYLPSKDELDLMDTELHNEGSGGFASIHYWSSSEYNSGSAWVQYFGNGAQSYNSKWADFRVRAIRAF